ncbi:hypothetical protein OSTOST_14393 [Ostertagia ostertagi]
MLLITALLFFSLLDVSAQTSQVESLTELMKDDIDDLLETKIGDLEWNGELAKEAENELKTHSKTDSRKADLKLEGTADVKDENKEQALLELLLRILGENEDKVRGISPGSQYGCGSLYEMDEDHSTSQVKLACLFRWTHLA